MALKFYYCAGGHNHAQSELWPWFMSTGVVGVLTSHWGLTDRVNSFKVALIPSKKGCSAAKC